MRFGWAVLAGRAENADGAAIDQGEIKDLDASAGFVNHVGVFVIDGQITPGGSFLRRVFFIIMLFTA